ncbi:MAG TPA: gamma-glutamyltransferase [Chthonomonadales bacterium]|nr:gamma-glutamyltransferase [Chthonomonadales bacterium]
MNPTQHRGVVVAGNGVVCASQPLAVSAGLNALQNGGTFADAAIATSAVLCVTEPYASHLGGDAFLVVYEAATGKTTALNGSGAAPRAATPDRFASGIALRGAAAASVPGLVSVWEELHRRWCSRPLKELLQPALRYAESGFAAGYRYCRQFSANSQLLKAYPASLAALSGGAIPRPGDLIVQPDLAWSLNQIAEGGCAAFYHGEIAQRIVACSQDSGGLFSVQDFTSHRTQVSDPISTTYRGYCVHGQPPVSQGHILLQELNLVEQFDLGSMEPAGADAIHVQVEAKRLAFADRAAYLGDPDYVEVPMEKLLSKSYAAQRASQIELHRAQPRVSAGSIEHDTTYFCVADASGNAVSFIQSVFWGFGCGVVVPGTGILLNNRMCGFSLDPSSPNCLAPGKRTAHTLNAYVITRDVSAPGTELPATAPATGRLAFVGGTPGGDIQVQSNLQVICNLIDSGMNPQEAIELPRWQHGGAVGQPGEPSSETLAVENRVPETVTADLASRGHLIQRIGPWEHGSAYQLLAVHPETGAYLAGSDPRCDGHAAGF